MMKDTHTPGEWDYLLGQRYARIFDIDGETVADLDVDRPFCEVTANCHLITAAPDMLATLRDIVDMLTDTNDMRADALHVARAAIMRATGGQG